MSRLPADCWNQDSTPRTLTFCPRGQKVTSCVCWYCKKLCLLYGCWRENVSVSLRKPICYHSLSPRRNFCLKFDNEESSNDVWLQTPNKTKAYEDERLSLVYLTLNHTKYKVKDGNKKQHTINPKTCFHFVLYTNSRSANQLVTRQYFTSN